MQKLHLDPTKGSCTISSEGGKNPQRKLWTLVHIYFADVDFQVLESYSAYIRSHNGLGRLSMENVS